MSFADRVYSLCQRIPRGKVVTYGVIATKLRSSPRAVGQALKKNFNVHVPCHRVICSDGSLGGYNRGTILKRQLLLLEGVAFERRKVARQSNFWTL